MPRHALCLRTLDERLAVCRLEPGAAVPDWADGAPFCSVTRTADELSVVCPESRVPSAVRCQRGWRALAVEGPLDFSLVGVLADLAAPLADAGIGVFSVSTFDTDYLLVKESDLVDAVSALSGFGHRVSRGR